VKKYLLVLLIALISASYAAGQELKLSGEVKTGILWEEGQNEGMEKDLSKVRLNSKDDAGGGGGRFRLNLDYDNGNGIGFRARIQWESFNDAYPDKWSYAFGYGNYFDDQLTVAIGKLGASPWGTGGPEMWKELETLREGGMRIEWKPAFLEPIGKFNVGFVLNGFDDPDESATVRDATLTDILRESILGFSYTHDLFHIRFAYRLDSDRDSKQRMDGKKEGDKFLYRIEERAIRNALPGFSIWAMGYLVGVGASEDQFYDYTNWLFAEYAPDLFTAQMRFGYSYVASRQVAQVKPTFYLNLFEKLISIGSSFTYAQDFGNRVYEGSPFLFIEVEPKIQVNLPSSYIALVYNLRKEYKSYYPEAKEAEPIRQTQYINLRFCIYF
jgi:hypothetical protein